MLSAACIELKKIIFSNYIRNHIWIIFHIYNHIVIEIILSICSTIKKKSIHLKSLISNLKLKKLKIIKRILIEWKLFFNYFHHSGNAVYLHCLHVSCAWNESSRNKAKSTSCLRSMNVQKQTWPANQTC